MHCYVVASNKNILQSVIEQQFDLTEGLIFDSASGMGNFPLFWLFGSTFSKTQNGRFGRLQRNDPDGPGLWLEPDDAVSILRNTKTVFFVSVKDFHPKST